MKDHITANVSDYIAPFPEKIRKIMLQLQHTIKNIAPHAIESISYGMPSYKLNGKPLIYFGAFKNHIGVYALPTTNVAFKKKLAHYKTGKGSIQFSLEKDMPWALIEDIVKFRVAELTN